MSPGLLRGCIPISLAAPIQSPAAQLRGGLLAWPWRAYAAASILSCAGSLAVGLAQAGWVAPDAIWPSWLVWHPAAAGLAAAPLFQLVVVRRAASGLEPQAAHPPAR